MRKTAIIIGLIFTILFLSCKNNSEQTLKNFEPLHANFKLEGRRDILSNKTIALIGSAASVEFNTIGDSVVITMQSQHAHGNSFVIAVNDQYQKRHLLKDSLKQKFTIHLEPRKNNKIGIFKATEAATGNLIFHGIQAIDLIEKPNKKAKTIEFIGNSITCGALADTKTIPCDEGYYHDHHNAYLAYGPLTARSLGLNYFLSSVSGIGMYRNWNDENVLEPILPQVYENLYLNTDASRPYDFMETPDIVSICIGTNDMSDGDGTKPRTEFNKDKFIHNYIKFIETINSHYPKTKIALLTSPILSGKKAEELLQCLKIIQEHFSKDQVIEIFEFETKAPTGCSSHPSIDDHKNLSMQLIPFFKNLLKS